MTGRLRTGVGLAALAMLAASACAGNGGAATSRAGSTNPLSGSITVFAASSLTDAFKQLGQQFEAAHPGTTVRFNFAASSALALQIQEGAPADVFASADEDQMSAVEKSGNVLSARDFATNVPVVVVPKGSSRVRMFADLASPGVKLVLAAPEVPIGKYARRILRNASGTDGISAGFSQEVLDNLQSNEANVRSVLAKIEIGEADAGIVYATDAATATSTTTTIAIPARYNVVAHYPVAVVKQTSRATLARAFVTYLMSPSGQAVMKHWGFGSAGGPNGG